MNLVAPEWSVRWTNSELQLYDKCGWLAKGPAGLKYISVMVAEHEIPLMVAAYQHGLKVDAAKILAASVKMQTTPPQRDLPGGGVVGNENLENYLKYGYVAEDGPRGTDWRATLGQAVWSSNTYEYAYDDWCVGQLALALGRERRPWRRSSCERGQNWRNQFDASVGLCPSAPDQRRLGHAVRSLPDPGLRGKRRLAVHLVRAAGRAGIDRRDGP